MYEAAKRIVDFVGALALLVLLSPVMALIAIAVRVQMGTPVLFRQLRPGRYGEPFTIVKFRTMTNARDAHGALLPEGARLTRLGRFLRRSSLDELPELVNVVAGEMSLVGPRPLLMEYLPLYSHTQMRRHEVRPGITGWAQVNGRNALTWDAKFELDTWYVDHRTLRLDFEILARTVRQVVSGHGVSATDHETMHPFRGSEP